MRRDARNLNNVDVFVHATGGSGSVEWETLDVPPLRLERDRLRRQIYRLALFAEKNLDTAARQIDPFRMAFYIKFQLSTKRLTQK